MILFGALMWFVSRSAFGYQRVMPFTAVAGTLFMLLGVVVIALGILQFRKLKTTVNPLNLTESTQLATGGIYRITRNPMYLGMALILVGWGLHLDSPVNVVCVAGFVVLMTQWQIKPEEAALRELFGAEYEAYCLSVRRWL